MDDISRAFVTIPHGKWGARQVHYRSAGSGPVVVLLHQSPHCSRDMAPTMRRWSSRFTCIAPDTPGYGLSDPLGVDSLDMTELAEAVIEFLDAVGIREASAYGFHTGATLAAALALAFPERITCAVAHGLTVISDAERQELLASYLPAYTPSWDGAHLTTLWARVRDQANFFPWYARDAGHRLCIDAPSPERMHETALGYLRAGDQYRVAYRAVFTFRTEEALPRIGVPLLVTASRTDPLASHLQRAQACSAQLVTREADSLEDALEQSATFIASHACSAPQVSTKAAAPAAADTGRLWNDIIATDGGYVRAKRSSGAGGPPIVLQHGAAASVDAIAPVIEAVSRERPVFALDLPGHGESEIEALNGRATVPAYVRVLTSALNAAGIEELDFVGFGGGGLIGVELARMHVGRVKHLVLLDPPCFPKPLQIELRKYSAPHIDIAWHGGHLLHAWHLVRDQQLFWPWYRRTRQAIFGPTPVLSTEEIHQRTVDLLKAQHSWRAASRAFFSYPVDARLPKLKVPVLLCAAAGSPCAPYAAKAADEYPHLRFIPKPAGPAQLASELIEAIANMR